MSAENLVYMPILLGILPLLGKALLMIPVFPNKIIPAALAVFNAFMKYWLLLGWPVEAPAPIGGGGAEADSLQLGMLFAISLKGIFTTAWSILEVYLWREHYEGKKLAAKVQGTTSFWTQGKSSMF